MGIVEQELDETMYWLELLTEAGIVEKTRMADLIDETDQLLRIVVTCGRKTKARLKADKNQRTKEKTKPK